MNICEGGTKYIPGNLYSNGSVVAIYNKHYKVLVCLKTGLTYDNLLNRVWTDVTDQYCLTKV